MCFRLKNLKLDPSKLDIVETSVMRWLDGVEVIANLTWDKTLYYLWFEITDNMLYFAEENPDILPTVKDTEDDIKELGVLAAYDIESINEICEKYCGDNDPAMFYVDDYGGVCGA